MRTTQADANEEIMNRIRELRKAAGYTQEKLASVLCVSHANLSGWELNKWQPDQDALNKMADLLTFPSTIFSVEQKTPATPSPVGRKRKRPRASEGIPPIFRKMR